jgi:hypothetical protein
MNIISDAEPPPACPKCGYEALDEKDPLISAHDGMGECPRCGIIPGKFRETTRVTSRFHGSGRGIGGRPFLSTMTLAKVLAFFLILSILLNLVGLGSTYYALQSAKEKPGRVSVSSMELQKHAALNTLLSIVNNGVGIVAVVIGLIWLALTYGNLVPLGEPHTFFSPTSAVILFLIPGLNLIFPYFILLGLWRGSHPEGADPNKRPYEGGSGKIALLWFVYLGGIAITCVGVYLMLKGDPGLKRNTAAAWAGLAAYGLDSLFCLLVISFVIRISSMQEERKIKRLALGYR